MNHRYLATSCLHGNHEYCSNADGIVGPKKPAECKFCSAPCVCECHGVREKLVRDGIPGLIRSQGQTPITRKASRAEFRDLLRAKLQEEVDEFLGAPDVADPVNAFMELVDVLEVVRALAVDLGFDTEELNRARLAKAEMRGTFSGRIVWAGNEGP